MAVVAVGAPLAMARTEKDLDAARGGTEGEPIAGVVEAELPTLVVWAGVTPVPLALGGGPTTGMLPPAPVTEVVLAEPCVDPL